MTRTRRYILPEMEYDNDCPITLERCRSLAAQNDLVITKCGHKFSRAKLKEWIEKNPTCPTCRHAIKGKFVSVVISANDVSKKCLKTSSSADVNDILALTSISRECSILGTIKRIRSLPWLCAQKLCCRRI